MTTYRGTPVSEGVAAGQLYLPDVPAGTASGAETGTGGGGGPVTPPPDVTVTADDVREAFAAVAADRRALAERLRAAGRGNEADIVMIGALMAVDPALSGQAVDALAGAPPGREGGGSSAGEEEPAPVRDNVRRFPLATAAASITAAAETQAAILEALPDPDLAQRAGDVRQVAAAVTAWLAGGAATVPPPPGSAFILVRAEVDPADLIRLVDSGHLAGAVSVGGGASSHAAIIARGLGVPMLAGADPAVVTAAAGQMAILDASLNPGRGELRVAPAPAELARARAAGGRAAAHVTGSARTADGELVTILCNVASAAETRLGLANGAAGAGLLRTEIPFIHATDWPGLADHLAALLPVLRLLRGKRAVVRLLDFAGDKVPPFPGAEGLPAFLHAPGALAAQLAAILQAGAGTDLAIMIPMVRSPGEVDLVRAELASVAKAAGVDPPPLGMMVELAATAESAAAFAGGVDFFSIGTNDLTADVLGRDRSALRPSDAAERRVLAAIATTVRAAREAGIGLSVCGDAAADPVVLPQLLAVGVRTVSVGAAKVPAVARWIADADASGSAGTGPGRTAVPDADLLPGGTVILGAVIFDTAQQHSGSAMSQVTPRVGIVLVSHSARLAEGAADLAGQVSGGTVRVLAAGGTEDGALGTSLEKVSQAVAGADAGAGVLVLPDLGSAVLVVRAMLEDGPGSRVVLADAPFVEGAVAATVTAAAGADLKTVAKAAEEAWHARKL